MIESRISREGYVKATHGVPYHVICAYQETGLACSCDISTGLNYNQNLRTQITKLIIQYGKIKTMTEICREAKRVNILRR